MITKDKIAIINNEISNINKNLKKDYDYKLEDFCSKIDIKEDIPIMNESIAKIRQIIEKASSVKNETTSLIKVLENYIEQQNINASDR